jgi:hypothetical protein
VVDSRARVRWTTVQVGDTKLAVLVSGATPAAYRQFPRPHEVPYFEVGDEHVDLGRALGRLDEVFGGG